jgi:hypothetical protein
MLLCYFHLFLFYSYFNHSLKTGASEMNLYELSRPLDRERNNYSTGIHLNKQAAKHLFFFLNQLSQTSFLISFKDHDLITVLIGNQQKT